MSNSNVDPSDLHLKRELTALRKTKYLRDPETSSSWRSPLSSRTVAAAASHFNRRNKSIEGLDGKNGSFEMFSVEPDMPFKGENKPTKVFLYNWRQHSCKYSDGGKKFDQCVQSESVSGSPEYSSINMHRGYSVSRNCVIDPVLDSRPNQGNGETPSRRVFRRFKNAHKQAAQQNLISVKSIGPPLNFIYQSDDTEGNSEDVHIQPHKFAKRIHCPSYSTTPLSSQYENWSRSSKIIRAFFKDDSSFSYTPHSTNSRYTDWCPSTFGSLGGGTASVDGDYREHLDSVRSRQRGFTHSQSKKMRNRSIGSCFSPSFSDTLRKKGSSLLCGSQKLLHKRKSPKSCKQKRYSKSTHSLPLLTYNSDGSEFLLNSVTDELSTNFGELELEASSRLDGKRWSPCRRQDMPEVRVAADSKDVAKNDSCLSQKYRPMSFDDLVGQDIVVQSLKNAIARGRVASVYLFQGPRGTGKTSAARIFAAALNCLSFEAIKPCGLCKECTVIFSGKSINMKEVEAIDKNGIHRIGILMKKLLSGPPLSRYKIFVINECHLLSVNTWSVYLKFLEEPPLHIIFIFVTPEMGKLPRSILTRCRRYLFPKVKDVDIVTRLQKLVMLENLEVDEDALNLMALNSDGSVRDAEIMLDQLSLQGKAITVSHVYDLVGVVSDDKLLDLLELAMSSDTAKTVTRARELLDSGVDPVALMSQLAGLIMDIIAGSHCLHDSECSDSALGSQNLTEGELERLKQALKILSEAEKRLRVSADRSTWFTAALLQLGSGSSPDCCHSGSTSQQSLRNAVEEISESAETSSAFSINRKSRDLSNSNFIVLASSENLPVLNDGVMTGHVSSKGSGSILLSKDKMDDIWRSCVEKCHAKTLRQLLCSHGRLVSILENSGIVTAYIAFRDNGIKSRAERFLSSITNSFEIVLKRQVEIKMGLISNITSSTSSLEHFDNGKPVLLPEVDNGLVSKNGNLVSSSDPTVRPVRKRLNCSLEESMACRKSSETSITYSEHNMERGFVNEKIQNNQQQAIYSATTEQKLESAWIQAVEKGTPGSQNRLRAERNEVLPQDSMYPQEQKKKEANMAMILSSRHWEIENEDRHSHNSDKGMFQWHQRRQKLDIHPLSPSLLHTDNFLAIRNRENLGYDSGPGCSSFLCWKISKSHSGKVKPENHIHQRRKHARILLLGQCGRPKSVKSRDCFNNTDAMISRLDKQLRFWARSHANKVDDSNEFTYNRWKDDFSHLLL